jgi:hypothetical protein
MQSNQVDLLLLFPPQWSPFQPPLSVPSLSAWLKRSGFDVASADLNVEFYDWVLSDDAACILKDLVDRTDWASDKKIGYRHIFDRAAEFRADCERLRKLPSTDVSSEIYVYQHYCTNKSFESYLAAVSAVCPEFKISPYEFKIIGGNLNVMQLERLIQRPPSLLAAFADTIVNRLTERYSSYVVGLSCIGQEQLYFTLLLGHLLKRKQSIPVIVGGTIFSRIFERGNLPSDWFGKYFDIIVRNEGEKPAEALLWNVKNHCAIENGVPGIVFKSANGDIVATPPSKPLRPNELPIPDFEDLPLGRYWSAEITLPLLSSRGCYWGKCEFCHHGMVYGEKYEAYAADTVLAGIRALSQKYGARHFAFNDEAIPPKIARQFGALFPSHEETGWAFTGLIKFEKFFKQQDFDNLARIGFRSLYVGLESGSERVLALMKKNNTRATMAENLNAAHRAGIWVHSFLFFGFPGEREDDALQTYEFVMNNADIMGSVGCGTFSLEHNAPIFKHLAEFGISLRNSRAGSVDVYYDYDVASDLDRTQALAWAERLNEAVSLHPRLSAADWVPREHLLCLIARMQSNDFVHYSSLIRSNLGAPPLLRVNDFISVARGDQSFIVVNRLNSAVTELTGDYGHYFSELVGNKPLVSALLGSRAFQQIAIASQRSPD